MAEDLSNSSPVNNTSKPGSGKYDHILSVIDELGKDLRPTYTGNRVCSERLKRNIAHVRILIREALIETEKDRQKASAEALSKIQQNQSQSTSSSSNP